MQLFRKSFKRNMFFYWTFSIKNTSFFVISWLLFWMMLVHNFLHLSLIVFFAAFFWFKILLNLTNDKYTITFRPIKLLYSIVVWAKLTVVWRVSAIKTFNTALKKGNKTTTEKKCNKTEKIKWETTKK